MTGAGPPVSRAMADDPLRPPGALRGFWLRHPRAVDLALAGAYLVATLLGALSPLALDVAAPSATTLAVSLVAPFVVAAALLVRRRRPWVAFGVAWIGAVTVFAARGGLDPLGIAVALYAVAGYRGTRPGWFAFAGSLGLGAAATMVLRLLPEDGPPVPVTILNPIFVAVLLVATLAGIAAGGRRRYVRALIDRAEQLARERDQQARLATTAERARIAREMHDVVAHSLTIIVTLSAGASTLVGRDPDQARSTLAELGAVGRSSLAEMRRVLGALGTEDAVGAGNAMGTGDATPAGAPRRPQPGLAELDDLVATFRTAGLPVTLRRDGSPPGSAGLQQAAHRIVQESLTNALRHAPGTPAVRVQLDHRGEEMETEINVIDEGRRTATAPSSPGSGRGLIGLRERAAVFGGSSEIGPTAEGGWRVRVVLPHPRDEA